MDMYLGRWGGCCAACGRGCRNHASWKPADHTTEIRRELQEGPESRRRPVAGRGLQFSEV